MMKKGLFMLLSGLLAFSAAKAQEPPKGPEAPVAGQQLVRLSKITVDPARLAGYNAFLQEEIERQHAGFETQRSLDLLL